MNRSAATVRAQEEFVQATEAGVEAGAQLARDEGATVSEAQVEAAKRGARNALEQRFRRDPDTDLTTEQVRAAARGATHGVLLQSEDATAGDVRWVVEGSANGAMATARGTEVGMQAAAYGAAHGSVARDGRATGRQLRKVSIGAASGATKGEAQYGVTAPERIKQIGRAHV